MSKRKMTIRGVESFDCHLSYLNPVLRERGIRTGYFCVQFVENRAVKFETEEEIIESRCSVILSKLSELARANDSR